MQEHSQLEIKTGCDIVAIDRFRHLMSDADTLKKMFHLNEMVRLDAEHLAGIFALKEATVKALGLSTNNWLQVEVTYAPTGKPQLVFADNAALLHVVSLDCSIAHDSGYAVAVVTVLKKK